MCSLIFCFAYKLLHITRPIKLFVSVHAYIHVEEIIQPVHPVSSFTTCIMLLFFTIMSLLCFVVVRNSAVYIFIG